MAPPIETCNIKRDLSFSETPPSSSNILQQSKDKMAIILTHSQRLDYYFKPDSFCDLLPISANVCIYSMYMQPEPHVPIERIRSCPNISIPNPANSKTATTKDPSGKKKSAKEKKKTKKKMTIEDFLLLYSHEEKLYKDRLRRGEFRKTSKPMELSKDDIEYKKLQWYSATENSFFFD